MKYLTQESERSRFVAKRVLLIVMDNRGRLLSKGSKALVYVCTWIPTYPPPSYEKHLFSMGTAAGNKYTAEILN